MASRLFIWTTTMAYCLLTGATGLVGRYVLRGLLLADWRVAVLIRRTRMHTARQRLEAVMNHWETLEGRVLPRPVLLEGDLCRPELGLDARDRKWIAGHCDAVLHGAAAMKFRPDDDGEPARTNVEGVRQVLDLCREAGIRKFHHVSTAYVCGLREGRILETELDLGQQFGNVYEKSKIEGEKLVRAADIFDVLTVYRPASVVGDSRTGHTTSYHGFYLPIQLGAAMASKVPTDEMGERVFKELGLNGRSMPPVPPRSSASSWPPDRSSWGGSRWPSSAAPRSTSRTRWWCSLSPSR
ncbi:MAG: hypothetical protein A2V98_18455 [Planctomycetes bacterium RBG_16_64_12]|nr:MAG: hypothetical protein A2V98_18455 [Planctomycetes bacterium RBG_16_64_12]